VPIEELIPLVSMVVMRAITPGSLEHNTSNPTNICSKLSYSFFGIKSGLAIIFFDVKIIVTLSKFEQWCASLFLLLFVGLLTLGCPIC